MNRFLLALKFAHRCLQWIVYADQKAHGYLWGSRTFPHVADNLALIDRNDRFEVGFAEYYADRGVILA